MGLDLLVLARRVDGTGSLVQHSATREQADDPRYYSAKFALGSVGRWEITVQVKGPEGAGEVSFEVDVQEPSPFGNPYVILTLALLPLVLVGWWLKQSSSPSIRPEG
jgi:hypothetical protein